MLKRFKARLLSPQKTGSSGRQLSPVFDKGFHGDTYLLGLVDEVIKQIQPAHFIETGTNVGTTARYVARTYPQLQIHSCEPDGMVFAKAQETVRGCPNAHLYNQPSPDFLYKLYEQQPAIASSLNLFWLDAHDYGFEWPLKDELAFISQQHTQAAILIDDAQVPDQPQFYHCGYEGQECNLDYMLAALTKEKRYHFFYPTYQERTSEHHTLRGYMMIVFDDALRDRLTIDNTHFATQTFEL